MAKFIKSKDKEFRADIARRKLRLAYEGFKRSPDRKKYATYLGMLPKSPTDYDLGIFCKQSAVILNMKQRRKALEAKGPIVEVSVFVDMSKATSTICKELCGCIEFVKEHRFQNGLDRTACSGYEKNGRNKIHDFRDDDFEIYDMLRNKYGKRKIQFYKLARKIIAAERRAFIYAKDVEAKAKALKSANERAKWVIRNYRSLM